MQTEPHVATDHRRTAWLSRGLEALVDERRWIGDPDMARPKGENHDFDVVIVGSGYGGSIAAHALAGWTPKGGNFRVCLLERGKEYLAGSFPGRGADLPGFVRFATRGATRQRGIFDGLYDVRCSDDAVAVVANGLGGGSLINAGVLETPIESIFKEARWPDAIRRNPRSVIRAIRLLRRLLGPREITHAYNSPTTGLAKTIALKALARDEAEFRAAKVTIANADGPNAANVNLSQCLRCGDCATGCNHNAKDSLDVNLLRLAAKRGVQIFTGATVLRVASPAKGSGGGWDVIVNHTDAHLRDRQKRPFALRTRYVILAAGAFGSTEILMRSRSDELQFSDHLGRNFSANGDVLVTVYDTRKAVNAVADESCDPDPGRPGGGRKIGPTITGVVDLRTGNPRTDVLIEDLAVPGSLRRLFEEMTTTSVAMSRLADGDPRIHDRDRSRPDDAAVDPVALKKSAVLAMIGRDDAEGCLTFGVGPVCDDADGLLTVDWPALRNDPRTDDHERALEKRLRSLGGRVVSNFLWRPLSGEIENFLGRQRGPPLTVHPLGGCAMGDTAAEGVTDQYGRVFDASGPPGRTFDGLVVLDGSIVPTSLGANPCLTIAALARRAIVALRRKWGLRSRPWSKPAAETRPTFATPQVETPKATKIELTEQVRGLVTLSDGAQIRDHWVEITITTDPAAIADLIAHRAPKDGRRLIIPPAANGRPAKGRLRILEAGATYDPISDIPSDPSAVFEAEISGAMRLFALESSGPRRRIVRAFFAWACNRGVRDIVQSVFAEFQYRWGMTPRPEDGSQALNWSRYLRDIFRVCSVAGGVRLVEYDFTIDRLVPRRDDGPNPPAWPGRIADPAKGEKQTIAGVKRITYSRCSSPLDQGLKLSLTRFPGMSEGLRRKSTLELNKRYLALKGVPLIRVVEQEDGMSALTDLLSLALYTLRVVIQTHALTFRRPDAPGRRIPQRLPGLVDGLPRPQIDWLTLSCAKEPCARIRLARYDARERRPRNAQTPRRPVLLIHGYSASGTTFVHPAVPGNLVEMLNSEGRDVWVLDMRSSAGLPTSVQPWRFEDMAESDIPAAINRILAVTGSERVDVVAHCMGCAMFSMAVLGDPAAANRPGDGSPLHRKIGRVVFSQAGPVFMLSRANVLAAYLMRYVRQFLSLENYEFSPTQPTTAGQFLDRALAAMPLSRAEYRRENPMWPLGVATPWVGTRRRIDALYARTFVLKNMPGAALDKIDDFFGPLSVETVSQVIHFAMFNAITDHEGVNRYVSQERLEARFTFPLLSIHGVDNGLLDVRTLRLMRTTLRNAGVPYLNGDVDPTKALSSAEIRALIQRSQPRLGSGATSYLTWAIGGAGHQDCLIGTRAREICGVITTYLCA